MKLTIFEYFNSIADDSFITSDTALSPPTLFRDGTDAVEGFLSEDLANIITDELYRAPKMNWDELLDYFSIYFSDTQALLKTQNNNFSNVAVHKKSTRQPLKQIVNNNRNTHVAITKSTGKPCINVMLKVGNYKVMPVNKRNIPSLNPKSPNPLIKVFKKRYTHRKCMRTGQVREQITYYLKK